MVQRIPKQSRTRGAKSEVRGVLQEYGWGRKEGETEGGREVGGGKEGRKEEKGGRKKRGKKEGKREVEDLEERTLN